MHPYTKCLNPFGVSMHRCTDTPKDFSEPMYRYER